MVHPLLAPRRVSAWRALLEAGAGYVLLVLLALALEQVGTVGIASMATILGLLYLAVWPAWRLRPVGAGRWWLRILQGIARAVFLTMLLGIVGAGVASLLLLPPLAKGSSPQQAASLVALFIILGFFPVRAVVDMGAATSARVQGRLRWQLMASHVGAIVLTFVLLIGMGSLVGVALALNGVQPDSRAMATSVADYLQLANAVQPFNARKAQTVLDRIESGRLVVRGQPALAGVIGRVTRGYPAPDPILVESPDGRILASVGPATPAVLAPHRRMIDTLRMEALQGHAAMSSSGYLSASGIFRQEPADYAAAPVRAHGQVVAVVLLRESDVQFTATRFFQGVLALFSVASFVLIAVSSLPILLLSFLFAFVVARGLTRRLESVSQVARAIAQGNFQRRAPVTSRNEIGRLAEDINRMAAELETTVNELRSARGQAEEALRTRQELVANVSHELRTPLAIMRAHLEALALRNPVVAGGGKSEEVAIPAAALQALQTETERLESLVDDLFALSRAQTGSLAVRLEPVDVAALVDEVAAVMRPLAQREGKIALSTESAPGLPPALADRDRLSQIVANLVRNAVRHTPEGGIIVLSVTADGPWVVISVADTGEGISPEHLPHIFDRFYRVDQARTRSSGGAGLGLAIVRELVELMGGKVTAESVPGQGSIFRVHLPTA